MPVSYEPQLHAIDAGLDLLTTVSMDAQEALSTPYEVVLIARTMAPTDPSGIDPGSWLRKKLGISVARNGDPTWFHGLVTAVEHLGGDDKQNQLYRIEVSPAFALLRHTRRTRVFTNRKPLDVVKSILSEGDVTIDMKAVGAGGTMRHITQFEESDFAFVSRLLEQEGACYWFTHTKSSHTMVIGDAETHHPGSGNAIHATYDGSASAIDVVGSEGAVTALSRRFEVVSKEAIVRDYSETHPKRAALAQKSVEADITPGSAGKYHEADYHVTQSDNDARAYAARLAESLSSRSCKVVGASTVVAFRSGVRVAVHGKDDYDEHLILNQVHHSLADGSYHNRFVAIPVGRLPWRPPRTTPIPRIDGVVPAIVTATAGAQGAGEDGAYRIKLLSADGDEERIVRMAQPYAGPAQGFHFPLPVNSEVLLTHEYGHPDRPIIAGAMHNAEDPSPVADANKTQCVVKSAYGMQLVFEDEKGSESVTLSTPKGNSLCFSDKDELTSQHSAKDHKTTVMGTSKTAVKSDVTLQSDTTITISATNKITLEVGGSSIVIEPSKITLKTAELVMEASGAAKLTAASITASAQGDAKIDATNVQVAAKAGAKLSGATVDISAQSAGTFKATMLEVTAQAVAKFAGNATCDVEGAMINIKGSGMVAIKGAMITNN